MYILQSETLACWGPPRHPNRPSGSNSATNNLRAKFTKFG